VTLTAEEVVQNLFLKLVRKGFESLGDPSVDSLKKHGRQTAIDFIRHRGRGKRGGNVVHLEIGEVEHLLDDGGAAIDEMMNAEEGAVAMELIERVVVLVWPILSDRERIILEAMLKNLPDDSTPSDIVQELSGSDRERLLPLNWRDLSDEEQEKKLLHQIGRSRCSVRAKMRKVRGGMDDEY